MVFLFLFMYFELYSNNIILLSILVDNNNETLFAFPQGPWEIIY